MNIENLSNNQKGLLFIIVGVILFLSQVGPFRQALHLIVLIASLLAIVYGFVLGDFFRKIKESFKRLKK